MRIHRFVLRKRFHQGIALLMVILIAALALTGIVAALSLIAPRSSIVKGESASDRALSCSDGMIDRMLDQVNGFGLSYTSETNPSATAPDKDSAMNDVMLQLLEKVNGDASNGATDTLEDAEGRTQTYLINATTNDIFRLEHGTGTVETGRFDRIASLEIDPDTTSSLTLSGLRQKYPGGDWFVAITGAAYKMLDSDNPTDSWTLTCTSWNVQNPEMKRTVEAEAQHGNTIVTENPGTPGTAGTPGTPDTTPWYVNIAPTSGQPGTLTSFADFVFLSDDNVAFAKSSVVTGDVMSNGSVYNGGWIQGNTTAAGNIYDTDGSGNGLGRFGPKNESLSAALTDGTAKRYQAQANFPNGDTQITAAGASTTGVYHITSGPDPATVVFNANGTVTINGNTAPMPSNGLIYVEGRDVAVHGVVSGRATVVTKSTDDWWTTDGGDIIIDGNLTYLHEPDLDPNAVIQTTPDALGLLAENNVVLGDSYYESLASRTDKRELDVDAAAMAVHGWIGIDQNASSHFTSGRRAANPPYTLVWKGARIFASFDNAPEITSGGRTHGYEVKQSLYDYAFQNYNCPPGFPYTRQVNSPPVPGESGRLQQLIEDKDKTLLTYLRSIPVSSLGVVQSGQNWYADDHAYYHVSYNGKDYYRGKTTVGGTPGTPSTPGTPGTWSSQYIGNAGDSTKFRISWRETIGNPLQPHD